MNPRSRPRWAIVFGPLAGAAGLGAGHAVAAITSPATSPILAVGSVVIDHTPTPLKEWAIAHFGVHDKTILLGSVALGVALLTVAIGVLTLRRRDGFRFGAAGLVLLALTAAGCALTRPQAQLSAVAPSVVTGVVAVLMLRLLLTASDRAPVGQPGPILRPGRPAARASRRTVLITSALAGLVAAVTGGGGQWWIRRRARAEQITLPAPASPAPPLARGLDQTVPGITDFRTPTTSFYRVDTRLDVPVVDSGSWRLDIDGDVREPFSIEYADLLALPLIERDITLTCVSTSVGGPYVGGARWLGVPLATLLQRAGVGSKADQILSTDVDGMTISTPLALATDGRDALIAVGMNGQPLPREHGFPARLLVPGLYGFIGATKWVRRLTLTRYQDQSAYWTKRGWATDAPIKMSSRIDTPRPLTRLARGDVVIGGIAWAQADGGVARVDVRIDGGDWQEATLGPSGGEVYWRQWFFRWEATPGEHQLSTRVHDATGQVQTPVRAAPFPDGASGWHTVMVTVT